MGIQERVKLRKLIPIWLLGTAKVTDVSPDLLAIDKESSVSQL